MCMHSHTHTNANEYKERNNNNKIWEWKKFNQLWQSGSSLHTNHVNYSTIECVKTSVYGYRTVCMVLWSVSLLSSWFILIFYRHLSSVTYATILICDFQFSNGCLFWTDSLYRCVCFFICLLSILWSEKKIRTYIYYWQVEQFYWPDETLLANK